jgi:hypothetical protein
MEVRREQAIVALLSNNLDQDCCRGASFQSAFLAFKHLLLVSTALFE